MPPADAHRKPLWYVLALLVLWAPCGARAQADLPLELSWSAPAGCPRAKEVRERVRRLIGSASASSAPLRVEASIERAPDGTLRLSLVTRSGELIGERHLDGAQCDDLANAAAIHVALLLRAAEPEAEGETASAPTPDEPASAPAAAPPTAAAPTSAAAQPPRAELPKPRGVHALLQLPLGVLALGPLPHPALGLGLGAGLRVARWSVLVEGLAQRTQRLSSQSEPGLGADLQRMAAALRVCLALSAAPLELAPCAQLGLEHLSAQGSGTHLAGRRARATWLTAGAGAQARLEAAAWLGFFARVDVQLEAARPQLTVAGLGQLGKLGPVAISLTLGAEWIL